jgi:hypothetical protein
MSQLLNVTLTLFHRTWGVLAGSLALALLLVTYARVDSALHVSGTFPTIQAAIDAAPELHHQSLKPGR